MYRVGGLARNRNALLRTMHLGIRETNRSRKNYHRRWSATSLRFWEEQSRPRLNLHFHRRDSFNFVGEKKKEKGKKKQHFFWSVQKCSRARSNFFSYLTRLRLERSNRVRSSAACDTLPL